MRPVLVATYADAWVAAAKATRRRQVRRRSQKTLQDTWKDARIKAFKAEVAARLLPRPSRGDRADRRGEAGPGRGALAVVRQGAQRGTLTDRLRPASTRGRFRRVEADVRPSSRSPVRRARRRPARSRPLGDDHHHEHRLSNLGGWRHDPDEVARPWPACLGRSSPPPRLTSAGRAPARRTSVQGVQGRQRRAVHRLSRPDDRRLRHPRVRPRRSTCSRRSRSPIGKKAEEFKQTATEAIYGMARVDIGGERGSYQTAPSAPGRRRPSARSAPLSRDVVGPYDGHRAKEWGANGVPADDQGQGGRPQGQDDLARHDLRASSKTRSPTATPSPSARTRGSPSSATPHGFCRPAGRLGRTAC